MCAQSYWLKTEAKYADIVLPVATRWERYMYNFFAGGGATYRDMAVANDKVFDPLFESKSDYDIAIELAEELGIDWRVWLAEDEKQCWFNAIVDSAILVTDQDELEEGVVTSAATAADWTQTVGADDSEIEAAGAGGPVYRPLVTITQEDIDKYGVNAEPQQGIISLEQFLADGVYRYERGEGGGKPGIYIAYEDFVKDPENHPLTSKSGKFEIYCQAKSDWFDSIHDGWPNYQAVSPLPKYISTVRGYVESFEDWEKKIPGKYPFMLSNSHTLRHSHTDNDNLSYLREAWENPFYISKQDADAKGIKTGDVVLICSDSGKALRRAQVSRFIMPGTTQLPHGCAVEVDEETGIDIAGNDNYLCTAGATTANGSNAWNSTRVNFEKYEGDIELKPDREWAPRVPLAD